ncbi:MAG: N-acetylmuramoyl-L-alanine amidase [Clostridiaceae bacterium]|nr:N-acetylmuramoyl-L-alanine amidase [Clostridiaceae bacterium]
MRVYFFKLRNLIFLLILTFAIILGIIFFVNRESRMTDAFYAGMSEPYVVIDAGHGGLDGGAVSPAGIIEAPLNLAISIKTRDIFSFLGLAAIMTREDENSLDYAEDKTLKGNKTADLKARLELAKDNPNCDFLSIHLNKFEQAKYKGAQVFYSPNNEKSIVLATAIQEKMRQYLDPENTRRARLSPDTVYLMKNIMSPAVTIECGFLSNAEEVQQLVLPSYQTKIALSICFGYIYYLEMSDV